METNSSNPPPLFQALTRNSVVSRSGNGVPSMSFCSSADGVAMALALVWWIANVSLAADSHIPMPPPQVVYDHAVRDAEPKGKGTGENFCWHAAYHMRAFVEAYQASHDPAWLDAGVKYYDWCVGKMAVGPDGYKGWIGPADNGLSSMKGITHS